MVAYTAVSVSLMAVIVRDGGDASSPVPFPQSNGACRPLVKKRAALCLLKMIRKTPADQQVRDGETQPATAPRQRQHAAWRSKGRIKGEIKGGKYEVIASS
jgi:hypothetical protein